MLVVVVVVVVLVADVLVVMLDVGVVVAVPVVGDPVNPGGRNHLRSSRGGSMVLDELGRAVVVTVEVLVIVIAVGTTSAATSGSHGLRRLRTRACKALAVRF